MGTCPDGRVVSLPIDRFKFGVVRDMDLQLVRELRNSIKDCSERGLAVAGKWYIATFHHPNLTLKAHPNASGLPSFISRYRNTSGTRLLMIQDLDSRPQRLSARAHLALRLRLPPHQHRLSHRLLHPRITKAPPSHPRVKNARLSLSRPKKPLFLQPSHMSRLKTLAERYTCCATAKVSRGSLYTYTANFW